MSQAPPQQIVEEIFQLYRLHGAEDYAGEKVTQLEHMVQAAELARSEGHDDEVVLAAFFHDLGHLLPVQDESETMAGYGVIDHEKLGAQYLERNGFSVRICKLVASHVDAKRYLTYKNPQYYQMLSDASKKTLEYQGGKMTAAEAAHFEKDPLFNLYIKMRLWDEAAKIEGLPVAGWEIYREMALDHLVK